MTTDTLGRFIRSRREAAGMSQEALAAATSLAHQATLYKIETGRRHLLFGEAVEIAGVLGFSLNELAAIETPVVTREQWWARVHVALSMARLMDEKLINELRGGEQT